MFALRVLFLVRTTLTGVTRGLVGGGLARGWLECGMSISINSQSVNENEKKRGAFQQLERLPTRVDPG
jgi:hypothetical protein